MSLEHRPIYEEDLPSGYKVKKRLFRAILDKEYLVVAEYKEKNETRAALVGFDGISPTPIFIETYLEIY